METKRSLYEAIVRAHSRLMVERFLVNDFKGDPAQWGSTKDLDDLLDSLYTTVRALDHAVRELNVEQARDTMSSQAWQSARADARREAADVANLALMILSVGRMLEAVPATSEEELLALVRDQQAVLDRLCGEYEVLYHTNRVTTITQMVQEHKLGVKNRAARVLR
jgi:hypothetical protein